MQIRGMESAESDVAYFEIDAIFSGKPVEPLLCYYTGCLGMLSWLLLCCRSIVKML